MGFVTTFRSFKGRTQALIALSFFIGVVLLVVMWEIDLRSQWLHNHAYIPNILAGFTGFLIGAPVALVILATFTVEREEQVALDRVNRISAHAWRDFRSAAYEFCSDTRIQCLEGYEVGAIESISREVQARFYKYPIRRAAQIPTDEDREKLIADVQQKLPTWELAISQVNKSIPRYEVLQVEWSDIRSKWAILDQYVRLQRLERGLRWFGNDTNAALREYMSAQLNPIRNFTIMHDRDYSEGSSHRNVELALDSARRYLILGTDDLSNRLGSSMTDFPHQQVVGYAAVAQRCAESLRQLREFVEQVDAAGWPESETNPIES